MTGTHNQIRFFLDQGTLGLVPQGDLAQKFCVSSPDVVFDPRSQLYRAKGYEYADLVLSAIDAGLEIVDEAKGVVVAFINTVPASIGFIRQPLRSHCRFSVSCWRAE